MTTNLHDKMLAAIDALFSASDAVEEEVAENLLLDVRDEINKHKLAEQEPIDFTSLLREAEEIVQGKPTWKRFIDGTPLSNDIAVWMAVFAQDVARRITKGNT